MHSDSHPAKGRHPDRRAGLIDLIGQLQRTSGPRLWHNEAGGQSEMSAEQSISMETPLFIIKVNNKRRPQHRRNILMELLDLGQEVVGPNMNSGPRVSSV